MHKISNEVSHGEDWKNDNKTAKNQNISQIQDILLPSVVHEHAKRVQFEHAHFI